MTTQRRKEQLKNREIGSTLTVIGLVLFICNWFKVIPGFSNSLFTVISVFIAYGFIIGLVLMFVGVCTYLELDEKWMEE